MDDSTLFPQLWEFLQPYLPVLLTEAAKAGGQRLSGEVVDLWRALLERLRRKPAAREALEDLRRAPEDPDFQIVLRVQVKKLLAEDPDWAAQVAALLRAARPRAQAQSSGIAVGGSVADSVFNTGAGSRIQQVRGEVRGDVLGPGARKEEVHHHYPAPDPQAQAEQEAERALRAYLRHAVREANVLPWTLLTRDAADPGQGEDLRLADVYIDLDTTELRHVEREEDLRRYLREVQPKAERIPVYEMVNRYAKLLIMGDPGSGKSTLVKHLTYLLAQAGLAEDPAPWLEHLGEWQHGVLIPVRVELRRMAAWAASQNRTRGEADLLLAYLRHTWAQQGLARFGEVFQERLNADETSTVLFLLDGLDEVSTDRRSLVVDTVNDLAARYPRQRYVVTCRPYAYVGQPWKLRGFHEVALAPFNKEQIIRFVSKWYDQLALRGRIRPDEAEKKARRLQRVVTRRDLRGLAERPLLLTIMAQLHAHWGTLPDDRTQLYADAVNLLLERWESRVDEEGLLARLNIPGLKMSDLKSGLYAVAYEAHSLAAADDEDAADIPEGALREWLAPYLGGDWNKAGEFVDYIRERAGLLIRHKPKAYTFPHRSFQEFLAAAHWLSWKDYPAQAARKIKEDWDRWREVFVLSAGYAARTERLGLALAAVNALLPDAAPRDGRVDDAQARTAILAAEALAEIGLVGVQREDVGRAVLERARGWLLAALTSETLPARTRAEAGRALAKIGDPRPEVTQVDRMAFAFVPAGSFVMGSDPQRDPQAIEWEQPQHGLSLDYDYWISRYPITNAQFAAFVDDGGYAQADLWPEAREAGVWRDGWVEGWLDDEPRDRPFDFGEPWNLPNHPVVGITWYEALAFARWLTRRWQAQGWLPEGWQVILPSEAEWEKAARGGRMIPLAPYAAEPQNLAARPELTLVPNPNPDRRYPWGDDFDPERANTEEAGLGVTSAVGAFPRGASPYDVLDLGGNVWEWTRSLGGDYPYPQDRRARRAREDLSASDRAHRVLRGGSFGSSSQFARAAVRHWGYPDSGLGYLGFRLVVVPGSAMGQR